MTNIIENSSVKVFDRSLSLEEMKMFFLEENPDLTEDDVELTVKKYTTDTGEEVHREVVVSVKQKEDAEYKRGCHFDRWAKKWKPDMVIGKELIVLGHFDTEQEARDVCLEAKMIIISYTGDKSSFWEVTKEKLLSSIKTAYCEKLDH